MAQLSQPARSRAAECFHEVRAPTCPAPATLRAVPETPALPAIDHDSILRLVFGQLRVTEDLLRGFASGVVGDLLDFSCLKQVAARHVSEGLRQIENDMTWEVCTRQGGLLHVYVMLEFQSSSDWTMPLRMANYVGQFYRGLLARSEIRQLRRVPQVLPIVALGRAVPLQRRVAG